LALRRGFLAAPKQLVLWHLWRVKPVFGGPAAAKRFGFVMDGSNLDFGTLSPQKVRSAWNYLSFPGLRLEPLVYSIPLPKFSLDSYEFLEGLFDTQFKSDISRKWSHVTNGTTRLVA